MSDAAQSSLEKNESMVHRCSCAPQPSGTEDRKVCSCRAIAFFSSSETSVPGSSTPTSTSLGGNTEEIIEKEPDVLRVSKHSSFSSPYHVAAGSLCTIAPAQRSGCDAKEDVEEEKKMKSVNSACTHAYPMYSVSSYGKLVLPSSTSTAVHTTTSGLDVNGITCDAASLAVPIDGKEVHRQKDGALECTFTLPDSRDQNLNEDSPICTTPKAREHRIPEPLLCPLPPKKKLRKPRISQDLEVHAAADDTGNANEGGTDVRDLSTRGLPFFTPPSDLHTYPDCIKLLFKK